MVKPTMYERFTDRARTAMNQTREIAQRFNQATIQPEHVLLGLLEDHGSFAALVFKDCGVDLDRATADVEALCQPGAAAVVKKRRRFSKSAKHAIELALVEARHLQQGCVGTEHLLLGCLLMGPDTLSPVCARLGLTVENVKGAIAQRYGSQGSESGFGVDLSLQLSGIGRALDDLDRAALRATVLEPAIESRAQLLRTDHKGVMRACGQGLAGAGSHQGSRDEHRRGWEHEVRTPGRAFRY